VDRRADIWAFGCVLYEMLTGQQTFTGEAVTDTLAAVIRAEPDWTQLPAATPIRVRVLLQRCLQKDPKQRLQAIGDARISLDEVLSGAPDPALAGAQQAPAPLRRRALPWAVAALLFVTLAPIAFLYFRQAPVGPAKLARFQIPLPEKTTFAISGQFALSPDGRQLAFTAIGADGVQRLWLRPLDSLEARPLSGADLGSGPIPPFFWSPDSRFIAFDGGGKLEKIDISGGPAQALCDLRGGAVGGSWNRDGVIIFAEAPGPVMRVSADGGPATPVTALDPSRGDITDVLPVFFPDGRHFIYIQNSTTPADAGTFIGALDAKPEEQPVKKLAGLQELYVPSSDPDSGYLFSLRNGALVVQTFDNKRMEVTGEPVALDEQPSVVNASTSDTGVLVYRTGIRVGSDPEAIIQGQLTWFDRQGKILGGLGDPGLYRSLAISPDGKRVAFERVDPQTGSRNIWLYEFARGVTTRFTFDPIWDSDPVWSPDGSHIAFDALRGRPTDLYVKASNLSGQDELLFKSNDYKFPTSWSPDGRFLLYESGTTESASRVWVLPLKEGPGDRKPIALVTDNFAESSGRFSPDGRWVAYQSNESGRNEIYVQPFDISSAAGAPPAVGTPTGKWQVSKGGGISPLWRGDGKELFYLSPDGMAMAVEVSGSGGFQAGVPKALFKVPSGVVYWDVTSDGKRFLMPAPSAAASDATPFTVVLNWQAELKK
jgi:eukaryotic-like serine/threonine-protein kinase